MKKIYYDKDADLKYLERKTVGIIGYGIQGKAQALNLRDSGVKVLIGNRRDRYRKQASSDGFVVCDIDEMVKRSDIVLFLIPDQAQAKVYERLVKGFICPRAMLVFAHGYALRYKTIGLPSNIDVAMLAPRMPGHHIRGYFLRGEGVPAFVDVIQDKTGFAWDRILSISKAAGFTRAGVMEVSYKVESDLDLFTEQFLVASIVKNIRTAIKVLVEEFGYPLVPVLMELYASGELAEVLKLASRIGIGKVFQKNASPTCQYGIARNFFGPYSDSDLYKKAKDIIRDIQNGKFAKDLNREGIAGYPKVRNLWKLINRKKTLQAQEWINKNFKWR